MLGSKARLLRLDDVRCKRTDVPPRSKIRARITTELSPRIRGFVVFGAHTNGTAIDPDEVKLSDLLAKNAGTAYGLGEANEARLRLAEFEVPRSVTAS